jgi:hypothetical protein
MKSPAPEVDPLLNLLWKYKFGMTTTGSRPLKELRGTALMRGSLGRNPSGPCRRTCCQSIRALGVECAQGRRFCGGGSQRRLGSLGSLRRSFAKCLIHKGCSSPSWTRRSQGQCVEHGRQRLPSDALGKKGGHQHAGANLFSRCSLGRRRQWWRRRLWRWHGWSEA